MNDSGRSPRLDPLPPGSILLAGPTGSGKSEIALELAGRLSGEIISVDSMQVYRGLDIGTAKPSIEDQRRFRHHLIDIADPAEQFDAARFARLAAAAADDIHDRGGTPILCGGTGLYFKALIDGLGAAPPSDPALRAALESTPIDALRRELEAADPDLCRTIDFDNPRRVIRAVEVIRITGRPFSQQRAPWIAESAPPPAPAPFLFVLLRRTAEDLRARIERRVDGMFAAGLVEETRRLLEAGLDRNPTAMQAIGYRQVVEHLRGERSLSETIALVKSRTRQFAKRQWTWFRRHANGVWLEVPFDEPPPATATRILDCRRTPPPGPDSRAGGTASPGSR